MSASNPLNAPPDAEPEGGKRGFDAQAARALIRSASRVALATRRHEDGGPQVSLATVAADHDGAPILLLSSLADHTRNIAADARVALLFDGTAAYSNPQAGPRVTVFGEARASPLPRHRARFLAHHRKAAPYADFTDFAFFHVRVTEARLVGGFAQAHTLPGYSVLYPGPWQALAADEAAILDHMNGEHGDALALIARAAHRTRGKTARMTGIDPEGCDLTVGRQRLRIAFPTPIATASDARRVLVALTHDARQLAAKTVVLPGGGD